jgi:hypothetical protein
MRNDLPHARSNHAQSNAVTDEITAGCNVLRSRTRVTAGDIPAVKNELFQGLS